MSTKNTTAEHELKDKDRFNGHFLWDMITVGILFTRSFAVESGTPARLQSGLARVLVQIATACGHGSPRARVQSVFT